MRRDRGGPRAYVDGDCLVADWKWSGDFWEEFYIGYVGPPRQRRGRRLASPGFQKLKRSFLLLQVDQLGVD
jgi:hypothetical protein